MKFSIALCCRGWSPVAVALSWTLSLSGQTTSPVSAPTETPVPTPVVSPSPAPVDPNLYLPQATVQITLPNVPSTPSARAKGKTSNARASVAPTPAVTLEVCVPDAFAITNLDAAAPPVLVTLLYNVVCADSKVTIAPLDGGTVNGTAGPKQITVGVDGILSFIYQPPATPGYYSLLVSLGGYQRVLPFQVAAAAPAAGN